MIKKVSLWALCLIGWVLVEIVLMRGVAIGFVSATMGAVMEVSYIILATLCIVRNT